MIKNVLTPQVQQELRVLFLPRYYLRCFEAFAPRQLWSKLRLQYYFTITIIFVSYCFNHGYSIQRRNKFVLSRYSYFSFSAPIWHKILFYKLELAKFMHKLFKNKLPKLCNYNFTTINKNHDYATRKPSKSNYFLPRVSKSAGQNKIEFRRANYGKKLVKILKINPSILLKSSLKKIYCEITDHTVRHWLSIVCTVPVRIWTCESFATTIIVCAYLLYFIISLLLCVKRYCAN